MRIKGNTDIRIVPRRGLVGATGLMLLLCTTCLDPYPLPDVSEGLLVVDARLTDDAAANRVILKFAGQVNEGGESIMGATVYVSDDHGNQEFFLDSGMGIYLPDRSDFTGVPGRSYVLHIGLQDGRTYRSDSCLFMAVPPISELKWDLSEQPSDNSEEMFQGIDIRLSTHDPENNVKNYLWTYEETWEVAIPFPVREEYVGSGSSREESDFSYIPNTSKCYMTGSSPEVMLKTTREQVESRIEDYRVTFISNQSSRLWRQYRIDVKQFALSEEAWIYHKQLNEITSQNGSVFDKQPFSLRGNIRSVETPEEMVMGYFLASGISEESIVLGAWDLPREYRGIYPLYFACFSRADTITVSNRANIHNVIRNYAERWKKTFVSSIWTEPLIGDPEFIGLLMVPPECASCKGDTETPEDWP